MGIETLHIIGASIVSAVIGYLIKHNATREIKKIDDVEKEVKEVKENYMDRFAKVNGKLDDLKQDVISIKTFLTNKLQ